MPLSLSPLFKTALTKSSKKTTPSQFDRTCVELLRQLCQEMNWSILRPRSQKTWADAFRLMRQQDNIPQDKIAKTLAAYADGVKAGKVVKPRIQTGEQFRQRWTWIEEVVAKLPPPASARAVEVARVSSLNYKWPKVGKADVAAFAQQVISFAEHLSDRLGKLCKRIEAKKPKTSDDRVLVVAANAARVCVVGSDSYARRYLERVRDEVRKWKDWSGSLEMYKPSLTGKHAGIKRAVLAVAGEGTWNRLKEELK